MLACTMLACSPRQRQRAHLGSSHPCHGACTGVACSLCNTSHNSQAADEAGAWSHHKHNPSPPHWRLHHWASLRLRPTTLQTQSQQMELGPAYIERAPILMCKRERERERGTTTSGKNPSAAPVPIESPHPTSTFACASRYPGSHLGSRRCHEAPASAGTRC